MLHLDLTLPTPAENLALDEALLDEAEENGADQEFFRLWESPSTIVVVGRSSRIHQEVDEAACRARGIPILRRSSGGAAIVAGPGCLMYAVVLSYKLRPELKDIRRAHCFVLNRHAESLQPLVGYLGTVRHAGTSDLVMEPGAGSREQATTPCSALLAGSYPRKFSGNSMRARRTHLLYHGTLLYEFDIRPMSTCLRMPPRQPDYRAARPHGEFLMSVPATRQQLVGAVTAAWPTSGTLVNWPAKRVAALVAERFSQENWNFEFE